MSFTVKPFPTLSMLFLSIHSHFALASDELNLDFLHGTTIAPSVLKTNADYPAGEYYVDVLLNKKRVGRKDLMISVSDEKNNRLCLSPEWLRDAGVLFKTESYENDFDKENNCYEMGGNTKTAVTFDYATQSLDFTIPQAYLLNETDPVFWDYGDNGVRLKYSGNFNKNNRNDLSAFGNFDLGINLGRWVLSSNMNASKNGSENTFSTNDITLSRAISQIQGDLLLGRSQTRTELFSDFGFYGAALRSNSNMASWSTRGYAPTISGVASSTSRITITQGGYTIYSTVVPTGPYQLTDISPTGNGDILITVEDESGHKTETVYPIATLPTLLRPGQFNYNFALGQKSNSTELSDAFSSDDGLFLLGSFDYGFSNTTFNTAGIFHQKYQSVGAGITQSLGSLGAISTNLNASSATYDNHDKDQGISFGLKYAKSFTDNTDLQLLTYRYQGKNYVEFANFDSAERYRYEREKARYEARASHRLDNLYLTASFWQQNYWNLASKEVGAGLSASTTVFDDVSLFVNSAYTKSAYSGSADYSLSMSMSIPFSLGGLRHYNSNSVGYSKSSGTTFNTGMSATVNDRLNYSLSANANSTGNRGASASVGYAFDAMQTNLSVSQSDSQTSVSGNVSGSVIATAPTGLLFSKQASDTIAVVNIEGMPGVTFNGSLPTDKNGNTVLHLSSYSQNNININTDNVPDNAELLTTSYSVVPTENAIIYRKFSFEQVQRYILRIRNSQGKVLTDGNAVTEQGVGAGFVATNGVLLMNMLAQPNRVTVTQGNGIQCSFNMKGINANAGKIQEVRCE